jgi:hypothetical protein
VPHVAYNDAFVPPPMRAGIAVPYADDDALPAASGGIQIVQPVADMYLEADPKRPSIYDAGNLAGAASHALRDQRHASQLLDAAAAPEDAAYEEIDENIVAPEDADYEEMDEGIVQPAPSGNPRSTVGAADWCHRPSPAGGTCTNTKVSGSNFCTPHLCEHPGCNQDKSSRVTACPTHLVAAAAGGNAMQPRLRASSNAGGVSASGGQGIWRGSDARKKGSVYEGFGGSAGAGVGAGAGDPDDVELEC